MDINLSSDGLGHFQSNRLCNPHMPQHECLGVSLATSCLFGMQLCPKVSSSLFFSPAFILACRLSDWADSSSFQWRNRARRGWKRRSGAFPPTVWVMMSSARGPGWILLALDSKWGDNGTFTFFLSILFYHLWQMRVEQGWVIRLWIPLTSEGTVNGQGWWEL